MYRRNIMLSKFIDALKTFFNSKPISLQFEEMLLQEAVQKIKDEDAAREKLAAVEAKATVAKVEVVAKTATPKVKAAAKKAVKNAKAEIAVKRTRKGGKFVKDDPATPDVNEAFKDGKAPVKKTKKTPALKVQK
jgi:hypothetical protein